MSKEIIESLKQLIKDYEAKDKTKDGWYVIGKHLKGEVYKVSIEDNKVMVFVKDGNPMFYFDYQYNFHYFLPDNWEDFHINFIEEEFKPATIEEITDRFLHFN
tara:strand:+ start:731 stop:1039 length:309 start_codon:yes stop_codon:yes gene_type:complete